MKVLGCHRREQKVKNSHRVWLLDIIFSPVWEHLRAISNSLGSSLLSFCTAMSAMGPRITTGRLKLAMGGQMCSGWLGARAELPAPRPTPHGTHRPATRPAPSRRGGPSASTEGSPRTNIPKVSQAVLVPTFLEDHPLIWWVAPLLCEGGQVLPALPQHLLGSPQAPQLPKLSPCPGGVGTRRGFQHWLQAGNLLGPGRGEGSGPAASEFEEQVRRSWHPW